MLVLLKTLGGIGLVSFMVYAKFRQAKAHEESTDHKADVQTLFDDKK